MFRGAAGIVILAVSLGVRVGVLAATRHLALHDDPADYRRLGLLVAHHHTFGTTVLAAGGGPTAFRPPLYPIFLGTIFRLTGDSLTAARLAQAALGTLTVALLGVLVDQLLDRRHALVAAGVASVYPPLVLVGNAILTESLSLPLELGALLAALASRRAATRSDPGLRDPRLAYAVLAGALTGLAVLDRPANGVLIVPVVLLLLTRPRRTAVVPIVAAVLVAAALLVPWELRNQRAFGRFVPITTADAYVFAGVYNAQADHDPVHRGQWRTPLVVPNEAPLFRDPRLDELALAARLRHQAFSYASAHPSYVLVVLGVSFADFFDLRGLAAARSTLASLGYSGAWVLLWTLSYWVVAGVAVAGAITRRARDIPWAIWLAPVLYVVATIPSLGTSRYRAPVEPFLLILAAIAAVAAFDRLRPGEAVPVFEGAQGVGDVGVAGR